MLLKFLLLINPHKRLLIESSVADTHTHATNSSSHAGFEPRSSSYNLALLHKFDERVKEHLVPCESRTLFLASIKILGSTSMLLLEAFSYGLAGGLIAARVDLDA